MPYDAHRFNLATRKLRDPDPERSARIRLPDSHGRATLDSLPFLWGAATSAHQVEGGDRCSDWYEWETRAGSVCAEPSGLACDHLHRYPQDIALLGSLGLGCYRFSVEWSRIEPEPGRFSERWLAHYRAMLECCRMNGLEPVLTLHHFTNPLWVAQLGGWERPETARLFGRYCRMVAERLGDLAALVITINEPNMPALFGYEEGLWPPGKRDRAARLRASDGLIAAHRAAVAAVRAVRPRLAVGMALAMADWQPLPGGERELDETRALREDMFVAASDGDDFLGINTYTRHRIGRRGWLGNEPGVELTATGFEFWPEALESTLRRAWTLTAGRPLLVSESGVATDDDSSRVRYIERAVAAMRRAAADGIDIRAFIYWSALDNFEWHHGYAQRFGLIAVERATQERTVRPSAWRLGELARATR